MSDATPLTPTELQLRIKIEELYANGVSAVCNHGLGADEIALIDTPEHGGSAAHTYGDSDIDEVLHLFHLSLIHI